MQDICDVVIRHLQQTSGELDCSNFAGLLSRLLKKLNEKPHDDPKPIISRLLFNALLDKKKNEFIKILAASQLGLSFHRISVDLDILKTFLNDFVQYAAVVFCLGPDPNLDALVAAVEDAHKQYYAMQLRYIDDCLSTARNIQMVFTVITPSRILMLLESRSN